MPAIDSVDQKTSARRGLIPNFNQKVRSRLRIDWLSRIPGFTFIAHGVRIGICADRAEHLDKSLAYLPAGWKYSSSAAVEKLYSIVCDEGSCANSGARFHLYRDNQPLLRCAPESRIFERLESDAALAVAGATSRRVFVHAGVVGWGGRAILIPGRGCTGKTTLVAELIRAGATYYSDRFAVLDDRGSVHPYARPLRIRESDDSRDADLNQTDSGEIGWGESMGSVANLRAVTGGVPLPIGLLLLSRYKTGAKWRPRHLSQEDALAAILENTVFSRKRSAAALTVLKEIAAQSFAVKGTRGEGCEVINWVVKNFDPRKMFPMTSE